MARRNTGALVENDRLDSVGGQAQQTLAGNGVLYQLEIPQLLVPREQMGQLVVAGARAMAQTELHDVRAVGRQGFDPRRRDAHGRDVDVLEIRTESTDDTEGAFAEFLREHGQVDVREKGAAAYEDFTERGCVDLAGQEARVVGRVEAPGLLGQVELLEGAPGLAAQESPSSADYT